MVQKIYNVDAEKFVKIDETYEHFLCASTNMDREIGHLNWQSGADNSNKTHIYDIGM